jgi:hypothetical protein
MKYRDENLRKQHLELKWWDESRTALCWVYSADADAGDKVEDTFHIIDTESSPRYSLMLPWDEFESDDLAKLEQLLAEYIVDGKAQIPADMNYCPKVHAINDARSHRDMILHLHDKHEDTYGGGCNPSLADWGKYGDLLLKAFGVDPHDEEANWELHKQCLKATEPEIVELAWTYCERLAAARDNDMRVVQFTIDSLDRTFTGLTNHTTWNGWANIWMIEEDFKVFDAAALKAWGDGWRSTLDNKNEIPFDKTLGLYSLAYGYCCEIVRDEDVRQGGDGITDCDHTPNDPYCDCDTCSDNRADELNYDCDGQRLTDCCGAYSSFYEVNNIGHIDTLCCKKCGHEVSMGEGDGNEYRNERDRLRAELAARAAEELTMLRSLAYKFSLLHTRTCCVSDGEETNHIDPFKTEMAMDTASNLLDGLDLSEAQQNYLIEL